MSTDVELYRREAQLAVREWGDERIALVVEKLMPTRGDMAPPTPAEVDLFAARCRATGLDPFSGQIHAIYRNDRNAPLGRSLTFQTGIDGLWLIAARTDLLDGQDPPQWLAADGVWHDAWVERTPPLACRVAVYRKGSARPFVGVAAYAEFVQTYDDRPQGLWARMPANQLRKCAVAQALRQAFANDLSDMYEDAELDHRDAVVPDEVKAERAAEADARADEQRIGTADAEAITALARAARMTRGEVRGLLEDVAGVGRVEHVRRRDLAAVLAALQARLPAEPPPPTVGEPEVVADGTPDEPDAEPVEAEPVDTEPSEDDAGATGAPGGEPAPASSGGAAPGGAAPEAPAAAPSPLDEPSDPYAAAMYGPGAPS